MKIVVVASLLATVSAAGYGPVSLKKDMSTGLELLALPANFTYMSYGTCQMDSNGLIAHFDTLIIFQQDGADNGVSRF